MTDPTTPRHTDPTLGAPAAGTSWCPNCNGYGSSLHEDTDRCTCCRGTGLIIGTQSAGDGQPCE